MENNNVIPKNEIQGFSPIISGPSVLRKINAMHADILTQDWEKDKMYTAGSNRPGYLYLSSDKLKQNISPLLVKHGIVFMEHVHNAVARPPIGNMTTHWTIDYTGYLFDCDTGDYLMGTVMGEGADSGDKAMAKATTTGNKLFWFNVFQIADGIDPEAAPSERMTITEDKKDLAKQAGVKPVQPAQPSAPRAEPPKAAVPKAEAPKAEVPKAAVPKAAVPKAAVPKAEVPKTVPVEEPVAEPAPVADEPVITEATVPQERPVFPMALGNAIIRIIEAHPELKDEANALSSIAEAQDFVANH